MKILPIAMLCFVLAFAVNAIAENAVGYAGNDSPSIAIVRDGANVAVVQPAAVADPNQRSKRYYEREPILELSAFNYFSIGVGHYVEVRDGNYKYLFDFGYLVKYKTLRELHLRLHLDFKIFTFVDFLLGGSGIMATNFDKITFGAAPHIGLLMFYEVKTFYRYNFYQDKSFNGHEIVLQFPF
jgi:hypothetical protein